MKKITLLFIVIIIGQTLFSQENYLPGHIIKYENDTLFGLINYKNWGVNPKKIMFKTKSENAPIIYRPTDIKEFSVNNEKYLSGIISIEISQTKTAQLTESSTLNLIVDTAFVQAIIQGDKSLYYYKDSEGKENFYIDQDGSFELLVHKKYLKILDRKKIIIDNKRFIGQLTLYLNDCSSIQSKLKSTTYSWKSLNNLFQFYYKCSHSEPVFQRKQDKISTEFGVLAGASLTSLNFSSDLFSYLVEANYDQSVNFSGGVFFEFVLPRNQGKWSIYNDLTYSSYKINGHYQIYENENHYTKINTEIGSAYLKLNNMLRFKYPVSGSFLFINAGISNGIAISETNYLNKEYKADAQEDVIEGKALNDTRKFEQGFVIGSGIKFSKYSCEVRYERANGMSKYTALSSTTSRFYFLLSYRF